MRANRRTSRRLHAALKPVTEAPTTTRRIMGYALAALVFAGAVWGVCWAVVRLNGLWIEQCVVTDVASQVAISTEPHVSEELVREWFGLTNGCNLARIDFQRIRERVLAEHPIVRELTIVRHLPNRVDITVEERRPIARVNLKPTKVRVGDKEVVTANWDVADANGVVFAFAKKDSQTLPVIVEPAPSAKRGETLSGRARSALRLVDLISRLDVAALSMPEVSIANENYLTVTMRDYSTLRILWRIIDSPDDPEQPVLTRILLNFQKKMDSRLYAERGTYTVVEPDRISFLPDERDNLP